MWLSISCHSWNSPWESHTFLLAIYFLTSHVALLDNTKCYVIQSNLPCLQCFSLVLTTVWHVTSQVTPNTRLQQTADMSRRDWQGSLIRMTLHSITHENHKQGTKITNNRTDRINSEYSCISRKAIQPSKRQLMEWKNMYKPYT